MKTMAHIIIDAPKNRYIVEIEQNDVAASKLMPTKNRELMDIIRENEEQVVRALFLSDVESRRASDVSTDLGISEQSVADWAFNIRKGRSMTKKKYMKLKSIYGVDALLKESKQ